jgi:hypothetical protein
MEAALALRSVERSVQEVLLPSLRELGARHGYDSAPWAFAAHWANEWLQRAQRLAPAPTRPASVLIGDATRDDLDPDSLDVRALELFCARAGARVLPLPVRGVTGLSEVLGAFAPHAVVIAGAHVSDDDVARWAYGVRSAAGPLPIALFRRGARDDRVRTTGARILSDSPGDAHREVMGMIEARQSRPATPAAAPAGTDDLGTEADDATAELRRRSVGM